MKTKSRTIVSSHTSVILFFLLPAGMLVTGYLIFPYPLSPSDHPFIYLPLFLGLILLGIGCILKNKKTGCLLKMSGWLLFSFFWAMMPSFLYFSEGGDIFNAAVCVIGVYVLIYLAYHEWLSLKRGDYVTCLNWIAGASCIAGLIYFTIDSGIFPLLKTTLIDVVAEESTSLLQLFGVAAYKEGSTIVCNNFPITIIFACTAIQSIVLFVGMIGALHTSSVKRKLIALIVTVIPIYFLNLIRNASVVFMVSGGLTSFEMAHNVIAKAGSLLALIVLLIITFKIVPELYEQIMCLVDLPKRKGPVETLFIKLVGKKGT